MILLEKKGLFGSLPRSVHYLVSDPRRKKNDLFGSVSRYVHKLRSDHPIKKRFIWLVSYGQMVYLVQLLGLRSLR